MYWKSVTGLTHCVMGLAMGFLAVGISPSALSAQPIDCDAIKNSTVPIELNWQVKEFKFTLQMYREASGDAVSWRRSYLAGPITVSRNVIMDGVGADMRETSTVSGKTKSISRKIRTTGFPKNFDRRSNVDFQSVSSSTYADGSVGEVAVNATYRFKSENRVTVGPCQLQAVFGEIESAPVSEPAKKSRTSLIYFPELKTLIVPVEPETALTIATSFAPMTPIP